MKIFNIFIKHFHTRLKLDLKSRKWLFFNRKLCLKIPLKDLEITRLLLNLYEKCAQKGKM